MEISKQKKSEDTPDVGKPPIAQETVETLTAENDRLKEIIEHLERQLGIDQFTGASNRTAFERELDGALKIIRGEVKIKEHRTSGESLKEVSLVFVDLDHFKEINDGYGHPAGDKVLQEVSALLMDSVRKTDVVARLGGDEFVVLLKGAGEQVAGRYAEEFRAKIERMTFDAYPELKVTASIGVISSCSSTEASFLYAGVDKALYAAKRNNRNQVVVYSEGIQQDGE